MWSIWLMQCGLKFWQATLHWAAHLGSVTTLPLFVVYLISWIVNHATIKPYLPWSRWVSLLLMTDDKLDVSDWLECSSFCFQKDIQVCVLVDWVWHALVWLLIPLFLLLVHFTHSFLILLILDHFVLLLLLVRHNICLLLLPLLLPLLLQMTLGPCRVRLGSAWASGAGCA